MKTTSLLSILLLSFFSQIHAAEIRTSVLEDGEFIFNIPYFKDSSFWSSRWSIAACYTGVTDNLCPQVSKDIEISQQEYVEGSAHDSMELLGCQQEGVAAEVEYKLFDDYSPGAIERRITIEPCN